MTVANKDDFPLGIAGFSFADLYEPQRLRVLHDEFWKYAGNISPDLATVAGVKEAIGGKAFGVQIGSLVVTHHLAG